ncbi:hypothetical protein [Bacillus sp. V59.32b]|uniref:hypothetical protein n=1 Tax=Bacillus sp. V59.32b TaxID=1758642 RepID=UPI000E3C0CE7|nr:hypothetical protein [Bacillus sp. V59.32b]RFU70030.1 hypothetical protein D0463_00725 [Bacillus sp. V59.32b]
MIEEKDPILLRQQLYNDIWEISVAGVAKKYNVPYAKMIKLCKESDIPIPPSGFWTKLRSGKPVIKTPLPDSLIEEVALPLSSTKTRIQRTVASKDSFDQKVLNQDEISDRQSMIEAPTNLPVHETIGATEVMGASTFGGVKQSVRSSESLSFLSEEEREKVLLLAVGMNVPAENSKVHKKINAYKAVIKDWNKKDTKTRGAQRSYKNFSNRPPFLAGVISSESLPRIFSILDALFRQIESLGGSINDDLSLQIRNEHVSIDVFEDQDKIKHEITRQEAQALIVYEDAKRRHSWASEPKIRKYDYIFNGRLRVSIRKGKYFRDTDNSRIESRLGDMLIELYEESEAVRIEREAREETARKREEEARVKEERSNLYNEEVERTIALENEALDYEKACKIRAYINAVDNASCQNAFNGDISAWIDWAKKKANWLDPIVSREDELLGRREHEKSEEQKALKKNRNLWW